MQSIRIDQDRNFLNNNNRAYDLQNLSLDFKLFNDKIFKKTINKNLIKIKIIDCESSSLGSSKSKVDFRLFNDKLYTSLNKLSLLKIYKLKRYGIKQFSIFEGYNQNRRVMIKKNT